MPRRGANSPGAHEQLSKCVNPLRSNEKTRRPLDLSEVIG